jgi:hypothetical protein
VRSFVRASARRSGRMSPLRGFAHVYQHGGALSDPLGGLGGIESHRAGWQQSAQPTGNAHRCSLDSRRPQPAAFGS